MGCPCEIQLYTDDKAAAEHIAQIAIVDIRRLEARYSRYRKDSLLSEINRVAANKGKINVDEETAALLNYADTCFQQSDGLFDITSGILRRVWRFDDNRLPAQRLIDNLLAKVGWDKVQWQPPSLDFTLPEMELDFGGIVKEYAADRAATLCIEAGAECGIINLGGDIKIIGPRPDNQPWRIGISAPGTESAPLQAINLTHGAVASSGDYERYLLIDGKRYGHVLNPKTGWPVRHLSAVTVISDFCVVAGSASTIAMLKEEQGPDWLTSMGLPHFWMDEHGNQHNRLNA